MMSGTRMLALIIGISLVSLHDAHSLRKPQLMQTEEDFEDHQASEAAAGVDDEDT